MTQEDKDLLLKDLCARLPYGVKLECKWKTPAPNGTYGMICTMDSFLLDQIYNIEDTDIPFDEFKPYLFQLSSMTEEQDKEYALLQTSPGKDGFLYAWNCATMMQWLIENHFDYNGLIKKGLANDATGLNIY